MAKVWYHICNDYTLERMERHPNDIHFFRHMDSHNEIDIYGDKWEEPIYASGPEGLDGLNLEEVF